MTVGKLVGKLYLLDESSFIFNDNRNRDRLIAQAKFPKCTTSCNQTFDINKVSNSSSIDQFLEWHNRLGHVSFHTMQYLDFLKHIPEKSDFIKHCEVCHKAKQQRSPFPISTIHTQAILELIHVDLWGPYKQFSLTATPYMLTIVDDFNRSTWTFLLVHKTHVAKTLDNFFRMVET